jgi:hypothetical protein
MTEVKVRKACPFYGHSAPFGSEEQIDAATCETCGSTGYVGKSPICICCV